MMVRWQLVSLLALGLIIVVLSSCAHQTTQLPPGYGNGSFTTPPPLGIGIVAVGVGIVGSPDGGAFLSRVHTPAGSVELNDVAFDSSGTGTGWAVGTGTILRTRDDAATWEVMQLPYDFGAVATAQDDSGSVWVGGSYGNSPVIRMTHDDGGSWVPCRLPHTAASWVNDLAFADYRHGWAVLGASPAVILKTRDGGRTWTKTIPTVAGQLNGIACTDSRHAWAVGTSQSGGHPLVLATTDGGARWRVQYAARPLGGELDAVTFADSRHGWAVGHDGLILATTDGGTHWAIQPTGLQGGVLHHVAFFDDLHGWAATGGYPMLWTADGGRHWWVMKLPGGGYDAVAVAPRGLKDPPSRAGTGTPCEFVPKEFSSSISGVAAPVRGGLHDGRPDPSAAPSGSRPMC
jgi:photosystem II stability/assembly factor-like uncharacterized protein